MFDIRLDSRLYEGKDSVKYSRARGEIIDTNTKNSELR
jgi:hypothetical protein